MAVELYFFQPLGTNSGRVYLTLLEKGVDFIERELKGTEFEHLKPAYLAVNPKGQVPTLVRMRDKHGFTGFGAANLSYGNYDTTGTPSQTWIGAKGYLLRTADIQQCSDFYAPDRATRRDPDISALYADVRDMPPALFSVGTLDPFLDDSLFLYARWIAAGNVAELAVYPGGTHGFNMFPLAIAKTANARIDAFVKRYTSV